MGWATEELQFNPRGGAGNFSLLQVIQTGPETHQTSYSMHTKFPLPVGKAAGMSG